MAHHLKSEAAGLGFFPPVRCFFAECPRKHSVLCVASLRSLTRFFLAIFYTNIHKIAEAFARTQTKAALFREFVGEEVSKRVEPNQRAI